MSRSFFGFGGKSSIVPVVSNFLDNFVIASAVGHGLFLNLLSGPALRSSTGPISLLKINVFEYRMTILLF